MRICALAAILAAFMATSLAVVPAVAQSNTVPADEDFAKSHLQAAQRLIDLVEGDATFDEILPKVAQQTRGVFTRTNPALTREIEEAVQAAAITMVGKRIELSRTMQLIYARRFTEEELGELAEFFSSPLGAKYIDVFPVIGMLALGAAKQYENVLSAEMVEVTREKLRENGHTL